MPPKKPASKAGSPLKNPMQGFAPITPRKSVPPREPTITRSQDPIRERLSYPPFHAASGQLLSPLATAGGPIPHRLGKAVPGGFDEILRRSKSLLQILPRGPQLYQPLEEPSDDMVMQEWVKQNPERMMQIK